MITNQEIKEMSKEELLEYINPLIELASQMLLAGTLKKNVIRHFTNRGLSFEAAENIMELGENNALNFSFYKFK
jgi:hypothetical protein